MQICRTAKPPIVYVSGRTSTGKTTFATQLHNELGYEVIELDQVVVDYVIKHFDLPSSSGVFVEVYRGDSQVEWIEQFVKATRAQILSALNQESTVVLEGAVANPKTLERIFNGFPSVEIFYFHPIDLENYTRNLTARFQTTTARYNAGLPAAFWSLIEPDQLEQFLSDHMVTAELVGAIARYAKLSQAESSEILRQLRQTFKNIVVIMV